MQVPGFCLRRTRAALPDLSRQARRMAARLPARTVPWAPSGSSLARCPRVVKSVLLSFDQPAHPGDGEVQLSGDGCHGKQTVDVRAEQRFIPARTYSQPLLQRPGSRSLDGRHFRRSSPLGVRHRERSLDECFVTQEDLLTERVVPQSKTTGSGDEFSVLVPGILPILSIVCDTTEEHGVQLPGVQPAR